MAKKRKSEATQARQFGVILMILTSVLALAFHYLGGHTTRAMIALGVGATAGLATFLAFPLWLRFFRLWMKMAHVMGLVMTTVILTLFYFLFFTPICLTVRAFGKRPLDLAWKDGRATYWIDKPAREETLEQYQRQF